MTIEELDHLNEELTAVLSWAFRGGSADLADRPAGVVPVEMLEPGHAVGFCS